MTPAPVDEAGNDRRPLPRGFWLVGTILFCCVLSAFLQSELVRPYLPPAGHGATLGGDSTLAGSGEGRLLVARPPAIGDHALGAAIVRSVAPASPAALAGIRAGDEIRSARQGQHGRRVDLGTLATGDAEQQIRVWRDAYWLGVSGDLQVDVQPADGGPVRTVDVARPPVWASRPGTLGPWLQRHLGLLLQLAVFVSAAIVLLFLRPRDATAQFSMLALALCGVAAAGSLMGSEQMLPPGLRHVMTVFGWLAAPLAFPMVALAIEYFPARSALLARHRWLHAVPFLAALPMIATGLCTGLFLAGVDALASAAAWDAAHREVFFGSFAAALLVNLAATMSGVWRYHSNADVNERRRIHITIATLVPAVAAYVLKDGVPAVSLAAMGMPIVWPWWIELPLYLLILLPAFGLTYAVAVHRVLAPRVALRRSLQYALARKTLAAAALLPAIALGWSLVRQRDMSLTAIVSGRPLFFLLTIGLIVLALKYRVAAQAWLDRRFFREDYDAKRLLLSLASRIPFETDPNELTAMVVHQVDEALHPAMAAVLVSGIEPQALSPVAVLHGSADPLSETGGLAAMLRWSEEPLEIYLDDPRSPARRLPPEEVEWLRCTGAVLLAPIFSKGDAERQLLGALVLGTKRSDEPYTAEDRDLISSIAAQVGLGLDVARLRRRQSLAPDHPLIAETPTRLTAAAVTEISKGIAECPRCGRCEEAGTPTCPVDGSPMRLVPTLPRVVDNKYRTDQLLGRGGMGAVYRARDMRLDRDVALKIVRADLMSDAGARSRFRREAQLVARLQHPFVVQVFDYGALPDGGAYLVMEYVRGRDLRRVLREEGPLPPERVIGLITAICSAIEAAHGEGILHRDLKPENILLPETGVPAKVLDFGVAKAFSSGDEPSGNDTLTLAGQLVGTPAYMAPEQLAGAAVTPRTDVFGLGVIAFEVLTGELPFGKGSLVDIGLRHRQGPPPMTTGERRFPFALESAIRSALDPDPTGRPHSAAALAQALTEARASL
jgi:eukaryotic-like serine/threonine-protein kinase